MNAIQSDAASGTISIGGKSIQCQLFQGKVVQMDRLAIGHDANGDGSSTDGSIRLTVRNDGVDRYIPKYTDLQISTGQTIVAAYLGNMDIPYMLFNTNTNSWYSYGSRKTEETHDKDSWTSFCEKLFKETRQVDENFALVSANLLSMLGGVVFIGSIVAFFFANNPGLTHYLVAGGSFAGLVYSVSLKSKVEKTLKAVDEAVTTYMKKLMPA